MRVQEFKDTSQQEMVIIPKSDYLALEGKLDALVEKRLREKERENGIPHTYLHRVIRGENPIKVYRQWRGYTQKDLSEKTNISQAYIAHIEKGNRKGSVNMLKAIALALDVSLDHIVANI